MSDTRTYYYARVSSRDQNLARQLEAFRFWAPMSAPSSPIRRAARI